MADAPYQLVAEIVNLSVAKTWHEARLEWRLDHFYLEDDPPGTCLCTHFPICEHCVLVNRHNGNEAVVGNCCVNRFLGLPSGRIFAAVKRVLRDPAKAFNPEVINLAREKYWINTWEVDFYRDTCRKRKLSCRQMTKRLQINQKILLAMDQEHPLNSFDRIVRQVGGNPSQP